MTDERIGGGLWAALLRLPRGSGVVFRHYATSACERRCLFTRVAWIARRRGLWLVRAGVRPMQGEDGVHNQRRRGRGLQTFAAHGVCDLVAARRAGADAVFVSPVFATRSHPDRPALGVVRFGLIVRAARVPVIALGGMDAARFRRRVRGLGVWGWAGIDTWLDSAAAEPHRRP